MRRMTKQRAAVAQALSQSPDFLSAQQLHAIMQEDGQKIGLATIYRNLQLLAEDGAVDMIRSEDGEALYRECRDAHHHHHLVCRNCQHSVEIEAQVVETWVEKVASNYGFTNVQHTVELFGLCKDCSVGAK